MVKVHVQGRDYRIMMVMLQISQSLLKTVFVMVVHERDRSRYFFPCKLLLMLDKPRANHVGNSQ